MITGPAVRLFTLENDPDDPLLAPLELPDVNVEVELFHFEPGPDVLVACTQRLNDLSEVVHTPAHPKHEAYVQCKPVVMDTYIACVVQTADLKAKIVLLI